MESKIFEVQGRKVVKLSDEVEVSGLASAEAVGLFVRFLRSAIKEGTVKGAEVRGKFTAFELRRPEMIIEFSSSYKLWKEKTLRDIETEVEKLKPSFGKVMDGADINLDDLFNKYQSNLVKK